MKDFPLQIVTPDKTVMDGRATSLLIHTKTGDVEILAGHTDLLAALGTGRARIRTAEGTDIFASVSGGFLSVANGGEICDEYRFLAYEEAKSETAEFFAELEKEELMEEKPHGVVFAKCPDGDAVLLLDSGKVARFSHEAPEFIDEWSSLAEFFEEGIMMEE